MNTDSSLVPVRQQTGLETSASASAALAKATIEAKFVIALQRPRSVLNARAAILDACHRPRFAEGAWYVKPVGKGVEGFSIRFAEQALNSWCNVDVAVATAWETDEQRLIRITVTDLQANLSYTDEVLLNKTVERSFIKEGMEVLGERENSKGQKTYIIRATEDDLLNKVNAAKSKSIRNSGLRLIPQDILEEAEEVIMATRRAGARAEDPQAAVKKLADAFTSIGVSPGELEMFLGHSLTSTQPAELVQLRGMYSALKDGEAKWSDYMRKDTTSATDAPGGPDDHIPGLEPATATPAKQEDPFAAPRVGRTPRAKAKSEPEQNPDPQVTLANSVITAGHTFTDFQRWGDASGNVPNSDSLSGFADVPNDVAKRLCLSLEGVNIGIAAMKGGLA